MDHDSAELKQDETAQALSAKAESDKLDAAARHIAELALLEARVQIARLCGA